MNAVARDAHAPGPEHVGELLQGFLDARGLHAPLDRAAAIPSWEELVGPQIARVSRAAGFDGGVLFVRVASSAWLAELKRLERELLRRLNAGHAHGRFDRIVFTLEAVEEPASHEDKRRDTKER